MLRDGLLSIGTKPLEESEETYCAEILRDSSVAKGKLFGSLGEQVVGSHFKGITIIRKFKRPDSLQCFTQASS